MLNKPQLLAIMFADLEAYSRHMTRNEVATIAFMERSFDRARRASMRFGGTLVKTTGDGWIALFPSAGNAVDCARLLQRLTRRQEVAPPSLFRISIHLGEVRLEGADVYGHAVNIAARLQTLAEPGGVIVSQPVIAMMAPSSGYHLDAIGRPLLKNIGDDLGAYRLVDEASQRQPREMLRLEILGGVRLKTQGGKALALRSRNAMALIGALALDPEDALEASRIAVMLWPGKDPKKARHALAQTRRLSNSYADFATPEIVVADGPMLRLDTGVVEVDLHLIDRSLISGIVEPALRRPNKVIEGLLSGLEGISPLFSSWLRVQRAIWRDRLVAGLELCLERHKDAQPALRAASETLLQFEPGHEPASHALMRHFAATGRSEAALREFDRLSGHLRDVYQLAPGSKVCAFASSLRGLTLHDADSRTTGAAPRLPQIAVGSFATDEPEAQSISEKFRSDLLANLSRFRTWAVLDMANENFGGADYVLTARCDMSESGANLSLRLVEPKSRRIAWSTLYSISAAEWRRVQGQIVGKIAAALEVYVSADRLAQRISAAPTDTADYDDWLRGESLLLRWTPEADKEAKDLFTRIISRTPEFAPAHASLASIHNVRHILFPGRSLLAEDAKAARISAALAVELDPMDARNHLALAWSAALTNGFDQAAVHLDLALSLNPYSPTTTISAAMGYAFLGDHLRAGQVLDAAIALAPMLRPHQWCYAAAVRFLGGEDAAAVEAARRSGDQIVDNQGWLAAALARQGKIAEAQDAFKQLMAALAPVWAGEGPPDAENVHAWFTTAYPIRREEDLAALSRALRRAMPAPAVRAISGTGGR
ncbi:MAG: adenylate/guanylate cyclase domain-containing protein [Cypionkella sp.]